MRIGKSAVMRSMIFWLRLAEQYMVIFLVAAFIFMGINFLVSGKENIEYFLSTVPLMAIAFTVLLLFAVSNGNQLYVSVVISFGSTRKNAFWGIHFMKLLFALQISALFIIYSMIHTNHLYTISTTLAIFFIALLFTSGLGDWFYILMLKYEKAGKLIFCIISGLLGGMTGIIGISSDNKLAAGWIEQNTSIQVFIIAGVIAVIVYLTGSVCYYRAIKKLEVTL